MTVAWWVWLLTVLGFSAVVAVDLRVFSGPHPVGLRLAVTWSAVYAGLTLLFCAGLLLFAGATPAVEFLTGFAVERALSIDNVFVFMVVIASFAVAERNQARVLSIGILGALALRVVLLAVGVEAVERFSVLFLVFGAFLVVVAVRLLRSHGAPPDVRGGRLLRLVRRVVPVADDDDSGALVVRRGGRRAVTTAALTVIAILSADVVFALDSVPAILGITQDLYLVVCANVFALLGLRPLYFLLAALRDRLVHLHYGLAIVLALIGVKLSLHYLHTVQPAIPEIPTLLSLLLIVGVFAVTTLTSLHAGSGQRNQANEDQHNEDQHSGDRHSGDQGDQDSRAKVAARPR
ncbi:MAG TPA: TerC/Alx family metal homeostasis membrane protein [Streptosporangiaceae bacterium]|jgi:tellurite resistance protein TerC